MTDEAQMELYKLEDLVVFHRISTHAAFEAAYELGEKASRLRLERLEEALADWAYQYPDQNLQREYADVLKSRVRGEVVAVYSRPECVFDYCSDPETCKKADACVLGRKS